MQPKEGEERSVMTVKEKLEYDLESIHYYYTHKQFLNGAENLEVLAEYALKAEFYHDLVKTAPLNLYAVYVGLYMEDNKQSALARKLYLSVSTLRRQKVELHAYLQKKLKEVECGNS